MKPDTNTVSNVAFSLACLMLLALGALEIEERVSGKATTMPRAPEPIESFDGKSISIADTQVQGSPTADVILIEFSDFQCPFCSRHDKETHELIKKEFVDSGRIRHAFMHLPLPIHPHAQAAGEAAECAGRQGRFWEMRHQLFVNQALLANPDGIRDSAAELEMDHLRFSECLEGETESIVNRHRSAATTLGVESTPTFLIGREQQKGIVQLSKKLVGAQAIEVFRTALTERIDAR